MNSTPKFSTISLWLFAAIGALASIATVAAYFRSTSAKINVTVYPNKFEVPFFLDTTLSNNDKDNEASFFQAMKSVFCQKTNIYTVTIKSEENRKHFCDHATTGALISESTTGLTKTKIDMYDLSVENDGSSVASGLRVSGNGIQNVDIYNQSNLWIGSKLDNSGAYILPDLNPGQKLRVIVWSRTPGYDYESFYSSQDVPQVSYTNGSAATHTMIHAPSIYADISYFWDSFPLVLKIPFFLTIWFVSSLPMLMILVAIEKVSRKIKGAAPAEAAA